MMISKAKLVAVMPTALQRADAWLDPLNEAMYAYSINSPLRAAAFLATVAVESQELSHTIENLNYTTAARLYFTFPTHFGDTSQAASYVGNPQKTANFVYASRMGNGPPESGDGWRYKGRGLVQLTGRGNYTAYAADKGILCVDHPELLELPQYAADSAGWFFVQHTDCLTPSDAGNFRQVTKLVNGGYAAWVDRKAYYDKFFAVL